MKSYCADCGEPTGAYCECDAGWMIAAYEAEKAKAAEAEASRPRVYARMTSPAEYAYWMAMEEAKKAA